ncbi:MAG: hypothetical protein ACK50E_03585 [Bacteroidota bacterium]
MLRNNFQIYHILLLISFFLMYSCSQDCATEICPPPNSSAFYIRLQNEAGSELLAGPEKRFDTSNLLIMARKQNQTIRDTITRVFITLKNKAGNADSIVSAGFSVSKNYAVYFLSLNGSVTDSLYFGYKPSTSECCDLSSYFFNKLNTSAVSNVNLPASYIIRK